MHGFPGVVPTSTVVSASRKMAVPSLKDPKHLYPSILTRRGVTGVADSTFAHTTLAILFSTAFEATRSGVDTTMFSH